MSTIVVNSGNVVVTTAGNTVIVNVRTLNNMVNNLEYTCSGAEGSTLTLAALAGKKILSLVRETFTQYEMSEFSANNRSSEFLWLYSGRPLIDIQLGTPVNPGERFTIIYRNY